MARRRKSHRLRVIGIVAVLAVLVAGGWYLVRHPGWKPFAPAPPHPADAAQIDAGNEGHEVRVSGTLAFERAPHDPALGVEADGLVLFRRVEMFQWQEHCDGANCRYEPEWSGHAIDSSHFRTPAGHANPAFPFADARFAAGAIRLGAYTVDPAVVAAQLPSVAVAATAAALPPNLAASFREADGVLYAGDDPAHPKVGALRVSFRVIQPTTATLSGVQRGHRLAAE